MYYVYHPYPYYIHTPMYTDMRMPLQPFHQSFPLYWGIPERVADSHRSSDWSSSDKGEYIPLKDYGNKPFVLNINKAVLQNETFRTAIWTGDYLQVTVMSIPVGESIGLELHPDVDQFIRIEDGAGLVQMGDTKDNFTFERKVYDDDAIMIPAGKWHNLTNIGDKPLKLYSIYAPQEHPFGTVHQTKADALAAEEEMSAKH